MRQKGIRDRRKSGKFVESSALTDGPLAAASLDEFFVDGDLDKAVCAAAHAAYGVEDIEYEWVPTVRYMGIFHEVQPASEALNCLDCHSSGGRLDWKALGYKRDPLEKHLK